MTDNYQSIKGLDQDSRKVSQTLGTYRYALNAVTETSFGDKKAISSEVGNGACYELSSNHHIIGTIQLDGTDQVIFSTDPSGTIGGTGLHEISLITDQCTRTSLVRNDCLDFSLASPITGFYRLREGCKRTIYFRDNRNEPRIIDIDSLSNYQTDPTIGNVNSNWNCNLMKWFPDYDVPCIDLNKVLDSGGQIPVGVVQFTITYMDEDLNPIGYSSVTNPIPIIDQSEGAENIQKEGGYQEELFPDSGYTNKSVVLDVSNIDTQFKYIRIAALESYSGTGQVTRVILKPPVEITGTTMTIVYTGFNNSTDIITTEDEVTQSRITFERFEAITQINNRAVAANTQTKQIDFAGLQNTANNIQVRWTSRYRLAREGDHTSKTPDNYFYELSMPRDEVVALALVPIFTDGTEGPAFHIPGRAKDTDSAGLPIVTVDPFTYHRRDNRTGVTTGWDSATYLPTDPANPQFDGEMSHIPSTDYTNGYIERWRIYNTAYVEETNASPGTDINTSDWRQKGQMGYHESTALYPTTVDCNNVAIYGSLAGTPIRHHRIPDELIVPHFDAITNGGNDLYATYIGLEVSNINLPASMTGEIQSWKIVRAEITDAERSVMDRGILFPNVVSTRSGGTEPIQYQTGGFNRHRYARAWWPGGEAWITGCRGGSNPRFSNVAGYFYNDSGGGDPSNRNAFFKAGTPNAFTSDPSGLSPIPAWGLPNRALGDEDLVSRASFHGPNNKFNQKNLSCDFVKFGIDVAGLVRWFDANGGIGGDNDGDKDGEGAGGTTRPPAVWGNESAVDTNSGIDDIFSRKAKAWCFYKKPERPNQRGIDSWGNTIAYYNRRITRQHFVEADTIHDGVLTGRFNNLMQQETYALESDYYIPVNPKDQEWGSNDGIPQNADWLLNLEPWTPYNATESTEDQVRSTHGQSVAHYVSIKRYKNNQYSSLPGLRYIDIDCCPHDASLTTDLVWGGETHIAVFELRKTDFFESCANDGDSTDPRGGSGWYGFSFLVESHINPGLRHGGNLLSGLNAGLPVNDCEYGVVEKYAPKYYPWDPNVPINPRAKFGMIYDKDINGDFLSLNYCHHNFYRYNMDFSKENNSKYYIPLEQSFDWCESCVHDQPHMLTYSESAFQEETTDNYRIFRPLNYKLVPGHTGELTNLFVKNNELYAQTEQSLWFQQTNPQQIIANPNNLYIGTGEFFSVPIREVISKPTGYGGTVHKHSVVQTEYGVFWVDLNSREVILFNESPVPISKIGMNSFFTNYLPLFGPDQLFALTGQVISVDDSPQLTGFGYTAAFDNRVKRYILTKRDYTVRNTSNVVLFSNWSTSSPAGSVVLNVLNGIITWSLWDGTTLTTIYPDNLNYFNNYSWTVSFSVLDNSWTSFHSYLPTFMYNDGDTFFSARPGSFNPESGQAVWRHYRGGYQNFYGTAYPFVVDLIANNNAQQTKQYHNIEYISTVEAFDPSTSEFIDKEDETFTKILAYTDKQATGELAIQVKTNPYDSLSYTSTGCFADRGGHNRSWRINRLRDYINNRTLPLFSKNQGLALFQTEWPIDHVINTTALNTAKSPYELAYLKDKYLGVRLFYNQLDSNPLRKISLDLTSVKSNPESR